MLQAGLVQRTILMGSGPESNRLARRVRAHADRSDATESAAWSVAKTDSGFGRPKMQPFTSDLTLDTLQGPK